MDAETTTRRGRPVQQAHPARLFALLAGAALALLGTLGFFYDASFGTNGDLADDDLAGILLVNGWRNSIYLVSGVLALAFASRFARLTALALGGFYLVFAIAGFAATDHGVGAILDALPLADGDNLLHLLIGIVGLLAALAESLLGSSGEHGVRSRRVGVLREGLRGAPGGRRRRPAGPRDAGGGGPR